MNQLKNLRMDHLLIFQKSKENRCHQLNIGIKDQQRGYGQIDLHLWIQFIQTGSSTMERNQNQTPRTRNYSMTVSKKNYQADKYKSIYGFFFNFLLRSGSFLLLESIYCRFYSRTAMNPEINQPIINLLHHRPDHFRNHILEFPINFDLKKRFLSYPPFPVDLKLKTKLNGIMG
jgi:hypothetical protein